MINRLKVSNFKSLKEIDIQLSNLNILTGLNGMGKSSLIQVLLLLRQSHDNNGKIYRLDLNDNLIQLGSGKDIIYHNAKDDFVKFEIEFNNCEFLKFIFRVLNTNDYLIFENEDEVKQNLPLYSLFNSNFQYLHAEHIGPQDIYLKNDKNVSILKNIGKTGEFTAHYLSIWGYKSVVEESLKLTPIGSDLLIRQVEDWLGEISPGTKIRVNDVPGLNNVLLNYYFMTRNDYTKDFMPINVGFGISYVLPVIVALLCAQKDRLIILENPEAHLHPRGQSKIGELIARAAQAGAQIILETHSYHIINGIRVATKNKKVDAEKIKMYFFDRNFDSNEHYSFVHEMHIDSDGMIDDWPEGFMDEWDKNLMELI